MRKTIAQSNPYLISALLGAIGGGLLVLVATKAIPTMLTNLMSGMMRNMKAQMEAGGCNPGAM